MTEKRQGRRSAEDALNTRYHILQVAAQLFCDFGYARVSLRNISEKAGVSHSLIRHHFGSKEKIWHSISDGLHLYVEHYMRKVIKEIPESMPANVKVYLFIMRLLAHGLIVKQPIQLIADAVRQDDALIDYFIDTSGEIERLIEGFAEQYNQQCPETPIKIWEVKWQMIMYTHSAASLTPFLKETWRDEEADLDQRLLNHWQLFNGLMIQKYRITDEYALSPRSVKELVYDVQYDWRKQCALSQPPDNLSIDEDSSTITD